MPHHPGALPTLAATLGTDSDRFLCLTPDETAHVLLAALSGAGLEVTDAPDPSVELAQLRTDVTTLAEAVLDLLATAGSIRATSWGTALSSVADRGRP